MAEESPFKSIPNTRADRWALLSQLINQWHGPLLPEDGHTEGELDSTLTRLRCTLPLALREWYRLAGRRNDVWNQQDHLLPPDKLDIDDGVLTFYAENQGVTFWG